MHIYEDLNARRDALNMIDLSQASWQIPCPVCQSDVSVSLGDIKAGNTVTCPSDHEFQINTDPEDMRQVQAAEDNLNTQLDDLKRKLGN